MRKDELAAELMALLSGEIDFDDTEIATDIEEGLIDVRTFEQEGILTSDEGLVIETPAPGGKRRIFLTITEQ